MIPPRSEQREASLPASGLLTSHSFNTEIAEVNFLTSNPPAIHTSDIGWAEVDLLGISPLDTHTILVQLIMAAELLIAHYQAIDLAVTIRIPSSLQLAHSLGAEPENLVPLLDHLWPAHFSPPADHTDAKPP